MCLAQQGRLGEIIKISPGHGACAGDDDLTRRSTMRQQLLKCTDVHFFGTRQAGYLGNRVATHTGKADNLSDAGMRAGRKYFDFSFANTFASDVNILYFAGKLSRGKHT